MLPFLCTCVAFVLAGRAFLAWRTSSSSSSSSSRPLGLVAGAVVAAVWAAASAPGWLVLTKCVGRALMPLALLWLVLLAATLGAAIVGDRRAMWRRGALALAVQVLGNEPLGEWLCAQLEEPYRDDPFVEAPFDAVVVLGGGASMAPHPGYELGPSGDRILLGARLYFAGLTPTLVTTGNSTPGLTELPLDSTAATTRMWRDLGIPADAIVPVEGAVITSHEAKGVAALVRARGWRRVGLVTSAWHMRRALGLFRREGVDVVPLAADHRGTPEWRGLFSVIPVGTGAWLQQKAAWEFVGALAGR